jgi:type IV secretion system protein VirB8
MSDRPDPVIDDYLDESRSWADDRAEARARSERRAWLIATIAICVAALEALAIVGLTPLKTVEPYTLLVDRQTGYVQALKPLEPQRVSDDAALTQSFLTQYVIAREGFDYDSVRDDYRKVGLWSAGEARQSYVTAMQASNVDSPLARYPRTTTIDVTIKSVTSLSKGVALVRFLTERRAAGGPASDPRNWVAVIHFGYSSAALSVADRMINPLGFQVSRYRRSYETVPVTASPATAPIQIVTPVNSAPPSATPVSPVVVVPRR